jgi:hypothetical protein
LASRLHPWFVSAKIFQTKGQKMNRHDSYEAEVMENELSLESGLFGPVNLKLDYEVTENQIARNGDSYTIGSLVSKHEAWFFDLKVQPKQKVV